MLRCMRPVFACRRRSPHYAQAGLNRSHVDIEVDNHFWSIAMETNDLTQQDRRGFLQVAGAAATLTLGGLPSAARSASEATGKLKIEKVGLMSPGDMGQAVAIQIKAKGL